MNLSYICALCLQLIYLYTAVVAGYCLNCNSDCSCNTRVVFQWDEVHFCKSGNQNNLKTGNVLLLLTCAFVENIYVNFGLRARWFNKILAVTFCKIQCSNVFKRFYRELLFEILKLYVHFVFLVLLYLLLNYSVELFMQGHWDRDHELTDQGPYQNTVVYDLFKS